MNRINQTGRTRPYPWVNTIFIVALSLFFGAMIGGLAGYVIAAGLTSDAQQPVDTQTVAAPAEGALSQLITQPVTAPQEQSAVVNAVETVLPAVVTVLNQSQFGEGSGSGFFVDKNGYVVTNYHVVEGSRELQVIYAQGGKTPATLVGTAPEFDIAVLKVDGPTPDALGWGDSSTLPLGTAVIAIGSVMGEYRNTVTGGILSGFNRQLGKMGGLLQTDAAINEGNSGGPLIGLDGRVIGINTLVVRGDFADAEGLGFAIPSNTARSVVKNLIEVGNARHPFLGIQYQALNPQLASEYGLSITEGALLEMVMDGTPAAQSGLSAGDVIVALDSRPVNDRNSLVGLLLEHVAGETITVDVFRDGKIIQARITLGERT